MKEKHHKTISSSFWYRLKKSQNGLFFTQSDYIQKGDVHMRTEKEKMLAGEMYNPDDPVLIKEREEARRKVRLYNQTLETEVEKRSILLKELLGSTGETVYMEPNIRFDYGYNTHVGENLDRKSVV